MHKDNAADGKHVINTQRETEIYAMHTDICKDILAQ